MTSKAEYEIDPNDGLPVLRVQAWAARKHRLLTQYIAASSHARGRFPQRTFIDLYCGPGRCLHENGEMTDGSSIAAVKAAGRAPFTSIYIADFLEENADSCKKRLNRIGTSPHVFYGKANETVDQVCSALDNRSLHLAFLDPFSLHALPFSIIESLSAFRKIDILIHFSAMDFVRNYERLLRQNLIDNYIPGAQAAYDTNQSLRSNRKHAFQIWYQRLLDLGFYSSNVEMIRERGKHMYWLIHATRNSTALNIWNDIQARDAQRGFGF
jgi:three-Cys-motif partner protein